MLMLADALLILMWSLNWLNYVVYSALTWNLALLCLKGVFWTMPAFGLRLYLPLQRGLVIQRAWPSS